MLPALFLEHCFHCLIHHFPGDEKKVQSRLMYKLNIIISDQRFGGQVAQTFFNEDRVRVNQLFEVKLKRFSLDMSTFL